MRQVIGIVLCVLGIIVGIAGVGLALWVGIGVLFVPGIEQIIDGLEADPTESSDVAWGLVKALLAMTGGTLTLYFTWLFAGLLFGLGVHTYDK